MLEYWMASNDTGSNNSSFEIQEVLEDPGSADLFTGYPPWLLYFAAGCCVLFMLIGIPGNLITIVALFRTKKLRNATAVFIMNLSISDLMFCCFNLPLATSTFWYSTWMHGPLLCRLFPLLRYGLVAVSLFTVLAITINRYVMIGHPRLYPKLYKPKYLIAMVVATWISGFGALVATWFEHWGRFGLDPVIGSCTILPDVNGHSPKEFLFILAFLTPCLAIVVCYARIFYIVRKTARKSRRREKVTTDLVKATLEVKYTKHFEDSAIGSSCGATVTTTENGGSPNSTLFLLPDPRDDLEKRIVNSNALRMENISEKNEESLNVDSISTIQLQQTDEINGQHSKESIEKIQTVDKVGNYSNIPNFQFSKAHESTEKLNTNINEKMRTTQVARGYFNNLEHCSDNLLTPPLPKYENSDMSEEFVSSRSDSPTHERREKKNSSSIFRRESRFPSMKSRGLESGKMTAKDKKLLKMILVIFSSFLICYLPITITKTFKDEIDWRGLNIAGYILIYLTTCINPVIYVVMSSEYRSAYKNVLLCRSDSMASEAQRRIK